jgi:hypothetical protein
MGRWAGAPGGPGERRRAGQEDGISLPGRAGIGVRGSAGYWRWAGYRGGAGLAPVGQEDGVSLPGRAGIGVRGSAGYWRWAGYWDWAGYRGRAVYRGRAGLASAS